MGQQKVRTWHGSVVAILTFQCLLGAGTMQWAGDLMHVAGHDAWLSILIAAVITALLVGAILLAINLHPQASPGFLFLSGLGPWIGRVAGLGFAFYLLADAARALRTTTELLHYSILPRSPGWALIGFAVTVMAVTMIGGLGAVIRFQMTLFWPTLLLALITLSIGFRFSDSGHLLPVLGNGFGPALAGLEALIEPVLGLELLLVYLLYARQAGVPVRDAATGALLGALGALGTYLYVTLVILVGFGPWESSGMTWVVLEAVRRVYLPGLFFERLDLLFLIVLLMFTSFALNLYGHAALMVLRQSLGLPRQKWHVWGVSVLISVAAMVPQSLADLEWWRVRVLQPLGAFYLVVIPLVLIGTGMWRHRRRVHGQTGA